MAWSILQGAGATASQPGSISNGSSVTLTITPTTAGNLLFASIVGGQTSTAMACTVSDNVDGAWTVVSQVSAATGNSTGSFIAYKVCTSTAARTVSLKNTGGTAFFTWALGEAAPGGLTVATDGSAGNALTTAGTTVVVAGPTPSVAGDLIISVGANNGATSWTAPTGQTTLWQVVSGSSNDGFAVYKINPPAGTALSTTFTETSGTWLATGLVLAFSGGSSATPVTGQTAAEWRPPGLGKGTPWSRLRGTLGYSNPPSTLPAAAVATAPAVGTAGIAGTGALAATAISASASTATLTASAQAAVAAVAASSASVGLQAQFGAVGTSITSGFAAATATASAALLSLGVSPSTGFASLTGTGSALASAVQATTGTAFLGGAVGAAIVGASITSGSAGMTAAFGAQGLSVTSSSVTLTASGALNIQATAVTSGEALAVGVASLAIFDQSSSSGFAPLAGASPGSTTTIGIGVSTGTVTITSITPPTPPNPGPYDGGGGGGGRTAGVGKRLELGKTVRTKGLEAFRDGTPDFSKAAKSPRVRKAKVSAPPPPPTESQARAPGAEIALTPGDVVDIEAEDEETLIMLMRWL